MPRAKMPRGAAQARPLEVVPCTIADANFFVGAHHRHHDPDTGALFALACATAAGVVAVAIVGRPKAGALQDGWTCEVTRLCAAPGLAYNASSMLLGAAWRAARALGWRRLVTYTLPEEGGASLRAAGWECIGETEDDGRGWDREKRPRVDTHPLQRKLKWEARP